MQTQEDVDGDARSQGHDNVEESLVTSGLEWRPDMVLPQGHSYGWRRTEAKSAKIPTFICQVCSGGLAWWYWAWRSPYVKDTCTDGLWSRRRCCHRLKWPGGDNALDQDLAMASYENDTTVHVSYVIPKPKNGVFKMIKARSFNKERFDGKITSMVAGMF